MGSFISADWLLRIDDDLLTHLEYVIVQQFRRGESFLLSWIDGANDRDTSVQRSLWLSPSIAVGFEFDSADPVPLQLGWASALSAASGSTEGLRIMDADGLDVPVVTEMRR
ncbi:ATP-dependent DNA ligase [Labedella endophytica]|uniref:ATP-dependent DNA ligase n=1 Tax=Labedella endophytica TaxID=1523160 RepID=A0A433JRI3_9MICO|nr:ATP-dependent DNA ligase [Labedella endophytica]RUR00952.1 ATP-dependent DNA ligase [Labedella endophytica]